MFSRYISSNFYGNRCFTDILWNCCTFIKDMNSPSEIIYANCGSSSYSTSASCISIYLCWYVSWRGMSYICAIWVAVLSEKSTLPQKRVPIQGRRKLVGQGADTPSPPLQGFGRKRSHTCSIKWPPRFQTFIRPCRSQLCLKTLFVDRAIGSWCGRSSPYPYFGRKKS